MCTRTSISLSCGYVVNWNSKNAIYKVVICALSRMHRLNGVDRRKCNRCTGTHTFIES